jgi:YfiR/HmsC-like
MKKFLVLIFLLASSLAFSQNYQLHSVFMYSFTRYVQWPNDYNHGDFEIMVLGDSPIIVELKKLAETKKVGTRSIKITRINSIAEIKKGNILFIPTDKSIDRCFDKNRSRLDHGCYRATWIWKQG